MNRKYMYLLEIFICVIIVHLSRGQDVCTPFPALENGEVSQPSPIAVVSSASFSCNEGYDLQGANRRVCLSNGVWTGTDSSCTLVDCLPLPLLSNGDINVNTTTFMSTASYSCDLGYQLDDDVIRTCQSNGIWSGNHLVCNSIDCGPLNAPGNGLVAVSMTTFMSTANYSCNSGYTLEADVTRTCQFNGSWSGTEPACNLVDCGPPPTLENGGPSSVTTTTTFNSFVMYECNEGYVTQLAVNTISFCQANEQWSDISVTCQIVTCNRLLPPFQATVSFTSMFNFGSEAIYSCINGFEIVLGTASRFCQATGSWNGSQPSCERVNCGPPSTLSNGSVTVGLTTFNSLAGYECDDEFLLDPPSQGIRSCTANRVWSGPDPTCNPLGCSFLTPPLFGSVLLDQVNQTSVGAVAVYACLRGFQLVGNSSRTCQDNGEWSSSTPLCEDVDECARGSGNCDDNANCINTEGGHSCVCRPGYRGGGLDCQNIDECSEASHSCHQRAICTDTEGSFTCACRPGFEGDGFSCQAPPCSSHFQLVLGSIVTCSQWFIVESQAKISDLTAGVLTTVKNECGDDCMLLSSQISNAQLDCTTSNVAVYRATLNVTNGENCTQIVAILQDWISTSPSLVVQSVRIRIASYCEVELETFDTQSDCINPSDNGTRPPTTSAQGTKETPSGESQGVQLSMTEIIAVSAVGGGVALLLILILLIICCVFLVRISRISKTQPPRFVEGASAGNDALSFQQTSVQRRKRTKPTYAPDLAQDAEFSTFTSSNDFTTPTLRSSYSQMTTPLQGGDTIMHNEGVADIEFHY